MIEKRRKLDEVPTELEDAGVKGLGEALKEKGRKHRSQGLTTLPPKRLMIHPLPCLENPPTPMRACLAAREMGRRK